MANPTVVYTWLDLWDQHLDGGGKPDLDAFVREHCRDADPELVAAFRRRAEKQLSINRDLQRFGSGPTPHAGSVDTGGSGIAFVPGHEPVPGYKFERKIGHGGFGEVWRGSGPDGRPVAIKCVPLGGSGERGELRAADLMLDVRHPNLIALHDARPIGGYLVIFMELADRTLADRLAEARRAGHPGIPREELLGYMTEAAGALDFLNAGGPNRPPAQHRDVKPQNLLLSGSTLKIADFGLARCLENSVGTHTGCHTPVYAAPEFFKNQVWSRSDQYCLAVTYCELRGGKLPFSGSIYSVTNGHQRGEPDLSMLPEEERPVIRRALAKTPKHRWPTCAALVAALRDGPNPQALRDELVAEPENVTLRKLYLAVRPPELLEADRATEVARPSTWLKTAGSPAVIGLTGGAFAFGTVVARGAVLVGALAAAALVVPIALAVEFAKARRFHRRVREALAELGPIPQAAFESMTPQQVRAQYFGPDRDLSDVNPEGEAWASFL
jgi:serine/threonine protein kinase